MVKQLQASWHLLWNALFLDPRSFDEAADDDNPFIEGLFAVSLIGVIVGIGTILGAVLGWGTTPDLNQIKELIHEGFVSMAWFQEQIASSPQALQQFESSYNLGWRIAQWFAPNPRLALLALAWQPLQLIVQWLWFATLAHVVARLLGGQGKARQTLGASALAFAPHLLYALRLLPTVAVAGVGAWTLIAQYVALRRVHENLPWGRVLVATLVPRLILWLLLFLALAVLAPLLALWLGGAIS